MKKSAALLLAFFTVFYLSAQDSTAVNQSVNPSANQSDTTVLPITTPPSEVESDQPAPKKSALQNLPIPKGSRDHLLLQFGIDNWSGKPANVKPKTLSRSFSIYFMYDFPFKSNPHLSVAAGVGISSSNMYFSNTYIDIAGKTDTKLTFNDVSDTTHFKKYKLLTTYLEAPVELRYLANPAHPKKSFKAAAGLKFGTMLSAATKGKNWQSSNGRTINSYTQKEKSKKYFNTTRISVTGRVGFGSLSLFGNYQVNAFVKEGLGPDLRPFTIGITFSGL